MNRRRNRWISRWMLAFMSCVGLAVLPLPASAADGDEADEMFFYRDDGLFRYYDVRSNGTIGSPIQAGDNYTNGWSAITAVDLDGDGQDEMFFYRDDGLFRYYDVRSNGTIGSPIQAGDNYTNGWSAITAVDLDGDGQDEMFFYRDDGLFRYYDVRSNGTIGSPIQAGDNYTNGWSAITAVDLDGDGQDEMFFYRDDGLFRYYDVRSNGTIGSPIQAGDNYTNGWSAITAVDLDGDGQDEMFFYRDDGLFRYYDVRSNGTIGSPIQAGDNYTNGWSAITAVNLDGPPSVPVTFGSGTWRVGTDIPPGTYRMVSSQPGCYWARLSGFSGELGDIIANNFTYVHQIVTIAPTDRGFESNGCGTWTNRLNTQNRTPTQPFGGGTWRVGSELAPGLWRNSSSVGGCYWERLEGFSGELSDIIANDFTYDLSLVSISADDVGFQSDDCGSWTYLGQ